MAMPAPSEPLARAPRIWAVGGGKGGVGKSVVTSSLAAAMAGLGHRVAVIDADLGAANLHTLLGAARPRVTLSYFLSRSTRSCSTSARAAHSTCSICSCSRSAGSSS